MKRYFFNKLRLSYTTNDIGNKFVKDKNYNLNLLKFSNFKFPSPEIYPNKKRSSRQIILDY